MEILNKKERYSAFVMFLLMFAITTGILIFALYFNFKLPLKENEVLKNENELMNKQFDYQKKFSKEFGNIVKMLDSLKKNPDRATFIQQGITQKLGDLNKDIPDDTLSASFYQNVIIGIQDLVNSKKDFQNVEEYKTKMEELKKENEELFKQNTKLDSQINAYNATSR